MKTLIVLLFLAAPLAAHAQVVFPPDADYRPLHCGNAVMTDSFGDDNMNRDQRDVVGDPPAPAAFRASDATNLYLRMRLEDDPAPAGAVAAFSWGMEFDLDDDLTDYEALILVEGISGAAGNVQLFTNAMTMTPNDPADAADQPPANTYTFANNARTVVAAGSNFGGNADYFLDFAVPWTALDAIGLHRDTRTHVWVASSNLPSALDGDFACHAGGGTPPLDSGAASDPTTGDPNNPGAGGGTGHLEGGGGCATSGGAGWLVLVALLLVRGKRRVA